MIMKRNRLAARAAAVVLAALIALSASSCKKAQLDNDTESDETVDFTVSSASSADSKADSKTAVSKAQASSESGSKIIAYATGASQIEVYSDSKLTKAAGLVAAGSSVEVLSENKDGTNCSHIKTTDGKLEGYIGDEYLVSEKDSVTKGETVTVITDGAQMFDSSTAEGTILETLSQGEELTLLAKTSGGNWRVRSELGNTGYVAVTNLKSEAASSEVGSVSSPQPSQTTTIVYSVGDSGGEPSGDGNNTGTGTGDSTGSSSYTEQAIPEAQPSQERDQGSKASALTSDVTPDSVLSSAVYTAQGNVGGTWSATYIDLTTGESSSVNSMPMQAASLIKLYIMGAVYEQYETFSAQEPNVDSWLYSMITVSDNTCANNLVSMLGGGDSDAGMQAVTSYAHLHGYGSTSMGRLLLAPAINGDNYTSTADCAAFLKAAYNGEMPHSSDIMSLLSQQTVTYKIPAGVPVKTANKTGELQTVQNDAAVVYADKPYVLCVMSENVPAGDAISAIVDLSSKVYASN